MPKTGVFTVPTAWLVAVLALSLTGYAVAQAQICARMKRMIACTGRPRKARGRPRTYRAGGPRAQDHAGKGRARPRRKRHDSAKARRQLHSAGGMPARRLRLRDAAVLAVRRAQTGRRRPTRPCASSTTPPPAPRRPCPSRRPPFPSCSPPIRRPSPIWTPRTPSSSPSSSATTNTTSPTTSSARTRPEGTAFLDEGNSIYPLDEHVLIHGHNMRDGSVFGDLDNFRDLEFLQENSGHHLQHAL